MSDALASIVERARLVVLVGEGGVGKTSCAAALALAAASRGRRVAVLTVDPAPRLGDALGLTDIGPQPTRVELGDRAAAGGSLTAMRLDGARTFDALVERLSPDAETAARLLANPIYRAVSDNLGGTEHYMAFQRLHELVGDDAYDLVVLDTPPADNARDLLSAPVRLAELVETGAPALVAEPARIVGRAGSAAARAGLTVLMAVLRALLGGRLEKQVSEFAALIDGVLRILEERASEVAAMLAGPDAAFVQVLRAAPADVARAADLHGELAAAGIAVRCSVVNRTTPDADDRDRPVEQRLAAANDEVRRRVAELEADFDRRRRRERQAIDAFRATVPTRAGANSGTPIVVVPARDAAIDRMDDLAGLGDALLGRAGVG